MTINQAMLQPAVGLVLWTLIMLFWMMATRFPALKAANIKLGSMVGTKGSDADRALPARAQWKAHNYMHLFEQPVLFYVVVIVLALLNVGDFETRLLAWGYVAFRVVHSVWQATVNGVAARFWLFAASTAILVALAIRAGLEVFGVHF